MEIRKEQEKQFHDRLRAGRYGQRWSRELEQVIQEDPGWANMKYYAIERQSRELVLQWFRRECRGKRVLDYCCGNGEDGLFIAQNGASHVLGIDLSELSIENCRKRARDLKLGNISFAVMDAESLQIEDDSLEVVTEYGALHHLDLPKAYKEMARVLKPQGKAICVEALAHNKIIQFYRKMTPQLRTAWEVEHILKKPDIYLAKNYFQNLRILGLFHLATLAAVPFRNSAFFEPLLKILETVDMRFLLRLPGLKWWAWQVVFELSKPLK
jgi:ubiquinone/menaquinone biosynthesis C-methylase UbiE